VREVHHASRHRKPGQSGSAIKRDRVAVLIEALRWACDALCYHLGVKDYEQAEVALDVARSITRDEGARFAFGSREWGRQLHRLRELAARLGPSGSVRADVAHHMAQVYVREAEQRLATRRIEVLS